MDWYRRRNLSNFATVDLNDIILDYRNYIEIYEEFLVSRGVSLSQGGFLVQLDSKEIKDIRQTVHLSIMEINNMWAMTKDRVIPGTMRQLLISRSTVFKKNLKNCIETVNKRSAQVNDFKLINKQLPSINDDLTMTMKFCFNQNFVDLFFN